MVTGTPPGRRGPGASPPPEAARAPDETGPAPLLLLAAALWLGIALPEALPAGFSLPSVDAVLGAAAALLAVAGAVAVFFRAGKAPRPRPSATLDPPAPELLPGATSGRPLLTGVLLLSTFAAGLALRPPPGLPEVVLAARALGEDRLRRPVLIGGVLRAAPEETRYDTVLRLESATLTANRETRPVSGPVRVSVGGDRRGLLRSLARGAEVEVWARVREARPPSNPGVRAFSGPATLFGSAKSALLVRELRPAPAPWRLLHRLRGAIRRRLLDSGLPRPAAAVAAAVLIGDRSLAPPSVERAFRDAGTLHVMAVSGLHVGLLGVLLYGLLVLCGVRRRPAWTVVLGVLPLYAGLCGAGPSVLRAALMASAVIVGLRRGLTGGALNGLGLAGLLLLAWSPANALRVGFQLSFGVTLAILAAMRPRDPAEIAWDTPRWRSRLFAPVAVTLAAQVAAFPIIAAQFGRIVLSGIPVSVPATLLAGPVLAFGFGWLLLGGVPGLGPALLHGLRLSAEWLTAISRFGADLPFGAFPVAPPGWGWLAAWFAAALAALVLRGRRRVAPAAALCLLALSTLPRFGLPGNAAGDGSLRLTALDVGLGDALVVELPRGGAVLVDAGTSFSGYSAGESVVVPFLAHRGHRRLEAVVPTHLDLDHIGGFAAVFRDHPVGEFWQGPATAGDTRPAGRGLRRDRRRREIPVRRLEAGERIPLGGAVFRVLLAGAAAEWEAAGAVPPSPNERSLVFALDYAGRRVLLTGDAGEPAERLLLARYPDAIRAAVLKVGHHGSRSSTSAAFLAAVRPEVAIVSTREDRRRRLPFPEVLDRLDAVGARVFRTDHHGAVTVEIAASGALRVRSFHPGPEYPSSGDPAAAPGAPGPDSRPGDPARPGPPPAGGEPPR